MTDSSFHDEFEQFRQEFAKERSLIMAATNINNNALTDLKAGYNQLINSLCLLTRLHYMSHTTRDFTLDEMIYPVRGISLLSVSAALKLFAKPNHKDRYSYLMFYLRTNPDLFSQIVYFALLTPSNTLIHLNDVTFFSEDDSNFFVYHTFPSIYNYFITHDDHIQAILLIKNLFKVHISLHKTNFAKPHRFLSDMISSLFLASNPGRYFDAVLVNLLVEMKTEVADANLMLYYQESGSGKHITRAKYWELCIKYADRIIQNMIKFAPLMPTPARLLISELCNIEAPNFPFKELFIFEPMICDYLENRYLSSDITLLHDVCSVIRSFYPQDIMPTSNDYVKQQKQMTTTIRIDNLIDALKMESSEEEPISVAIRSCEETTLVTSRDLTLLSQSIELFVKYARKDKIKDLLTNITGLSRPTKCDDRDIIPLKTWTKQLPRTKSDMKPTRAFDDIIDALNMIDSKNVPYSNPEELGEAALKYCGNCLTWMQQLRIRETPNICSGMDNSLKVVKNNRMNLTQFSESLFSSLFSVTYEQKRHSTQINNLLKLLFSFRLIPMYFETFPYDFDFNCNDVTSSKATIDKVFAAIDAHITPEKFPKLYNNALQRSLMLFHIDELDKMFDYQMISVKDISGEKGISKMKLFVENHQGSQPESITIGERNLIDSAKGLIKLVRHASPPSSNLEIVLRAMKLLKKWESDAFTAYIIASSENPQIIAFANFIKTYIPYKKPVTRLETTIFVSNNQRNMMKKFVNAINLIQENIK